MNTRTAMGLTPAGRERIEGGLRRFVDRGKIAGVVALLWRADPSDGAAPEPYVFAYGARDLAGGDPIGPTTLMRIASLTKPITAAATFVLIEEGLLALDDPVSRFIPGFADLRVLADAKRGQTEPLARPITIRHLLTHTSGLAYGLFQGPVESRYRQARVTRMKLAPMVEALLELPLAAQPGGVFKYSISYDVLGYLIEQITGQTFDAFLRSRIFEPLGMGDTGFVVPEVLADRLSALYAAPSGGRRPERLDDRRGYLDPDRPLSGGGGLVSTGPDYMRFMRMILNDGTLGGTRILKPETVAMMTANQLPDSMIPIAMGPLDMSGMGYGMGFGVKVTPPASAGDPPAGTFWWAGMTGTLAWGDPAHDLIGVVMVQAMRYWEPAYTFQRLVYRTLQPES